MNIAYNCDCMEYMKTLPDKYFDLAVVDPPYGGGGSQNVQVERERERERERETGCAAESVSTRAQSSDASAVGLSATISAERTGGAWFNKYKRQGGVFSGQDIKTVRTGGRTARYIPKAADEDALAEDVHNCRGRFSKYGADIRHWDFAPPQEYFDELARISKNQIIWGGNYFDLPPTRCFLVWRKLSISENFSMAMAEYAWTSFNANAKVFEFPPQGNKEARMHPTQKPIELYAWIYRLYAEKGFKIFDSHMGSGSSRIAAYDAGLDYVGCEIDPYYFQMEEERFEQHTAQQSLFVAPQTSIFTDGEDET